MQTTTQGALRPRPMARSLALIGALTAAALLAACGTPRPRAPVEDRMQMPRQSAPMAAPIGQAGAMAGDPAKALPGAENLGKPGYYAVKPGDTLIRIGLENGQNWKDLVRWNNLDNPNLIEVGQVLRVVPPAVDPTVAGTRGVATVRIDPRPLDSRGVPVAPPPSVTGAPTAPLVVPAPPVASTRENDEDVNWAWPASGSVVTSFDEAKSKGLAIAGKAGDPVLASADGRVVYAGSGLRGYGNLVILKHNNTYLTAYAHNQSLLVKEDQNVRRGQKIAEMGSTDADRVQLHFEIRKQGKPVDPAKFLPAR